jgi:GNAT superfamily N-acetyltransferase
MYLDYIKERYRPEDFLLLSQTQVAETFEKALKSSELYQHRTDKGFITYDLKGDAVVIYDMYVKPAYRGHTHAWDLHDEVIKHAQAEGKRVAIAISERAGQNHQRGFGAMKVSGFHLHQKLNDSFIFIKGI